MDNFTKNEHMQGGKPKKVICDNIIYDNIKDCADKYEVKANTMTKWLNGRNNMPPKFYALGLRYLDDNDYTLKQYAPNPNVTKVYCIDDDVLFDSIRECVDYYIAKGYNVSSAQISSVISNTCKHKKYTSGGLHFCNYDDYIKLFCNKSLYERQQNAKLFEKPKQGRKIYKYDSNDVLVCVYDDINDCVVDTNFAKSTIYDYIHSQELLRGHRYAYE